MLARLLRITALGACGALAFGCAQFPSVPYNKAAPDKPASVGIAPLFTPEKPQMLIVGAAGNNFGLVGALVEAGRAASAATATQQAMAAAEFDHGAALKSRIVRAFEDAGFTVALLPGERASSERIKFLKKPPDAAGNAAVADVVTKFLGFVAGGATTPYRPTLNVELRLLDAKSAKVLFAEQIHYNHFDPAAPSAVALEPNLDCSFENVKAIEAAPTKAADCLAQAIEAVGAEITRQLR
jgi:hypothetical protein